MRIKKGFVLEKVADSYLACATGKLAREFRGFVKLNETGAFLWEKLCEANVTEAQLVDMLLAEYDTERSVAERDVRSFAESLSQAGILE